MKKLFRFSLLGIAFAALTTACNVQETRMPQEETPDAALAGCPHERPVVCGATATYTSRDASGSSVILTPSGSRTMGTVELDHDGTNLSIFSGNGPDGLVVAGMDVYVGTFADIPLNMDGTVNAAAFPYHSVASPIGCPEAMEVPFSLGCATVAVRTQYVLLDFFGNVIATYYGWIGTTRAGTDGWATEFCAIECVVVTVSPSCTTILPGYTPSCQTLTASVSSGFTAVSYEWSTGETTASITPCPSVSTTYSVTVVASSTGGYSVGTGSADIIVLSAPCGGGGSNKIELCDHAPATPTTHCKSTSFLFNYLDSHGGVSALAPGASRYTIGPCDAPVYPCL